MQNITDWPDPDEFMDSGPLSPKKYVHTRSLNLVSRRVNAFSVEHDEPESTGTFPCPECKQTAKETHSDCYYEYYTCSNSNCNYNFRVN